MSNAAPSRTALSIYPQVDGMISFGAVAEEDLLPRDFLGLPAAAASPESVSCSARSAFIFEQAGEDFVARNGLRARLSPW